MRTNWVQFATPVLLALAVYQSGETAKAVPGRTRERLGVERAEIVRGTRVLRSGVIYELVHDLHVQGGTLVIEAGTRVEAAPGTGIIVDRAGRIDANGTASEPIILTCSSPGQPGCWNGVVINGSARVNTGAPTSPVIAGRSATGGCLEVTAPSGAYGGCEDNDSSGVLRYVWLQDAGGADGAALSLRAVGAHTVVNNIQVLRSLSSGISLRGGTVNLRYLRTILAAGVSLSWSEGWRGRAQYGVIQAKTGSLAAIEGGNLETNPDALPRSAPVLRNFTIIGPSTADEGSGAAGVRLKSGSAATLQGFVVLNQPSTGAWAFDIDDDATWARFDQNEVHFEASLFVGFAPLGSLDEDPPHQGFFSPDVEGQILREPSATNRVIVDFDTVANQIKAAFGEIPDLRPKPGSALSNVPCKSRREIRSSMS